VRKEEAKLVATHRLSVEFVRASGAKVECKMACATCGNVVLVYVWEDDYVSAQEAEERAVDSGKRNFRYDCASYLAESVMES
jgi:hypothetical protein